MRDNPGWFSDPDAIPNQKGAPIKLAERYFYPAVFTYEPEQKIAVVFPDLDVATSGVDDTDALLSARELLGCAMFGLEEDGEEIPAPTPTFTLKIMKKRC